VGFIIGFDKRGTFSFESVLRKPKLRDTFVLQRACSVNHRGGCMHATSSMVMSRQPSPLSPILLGGSVAGILDLTYAIVFSSFFGVAPTRVAQSIASGLLGPGAFKGGLPTAALGVVLHFVIAITAAAVYFAVSRKWALLVKQATLCGLLYGIAIYVFMNYVVLPLSAAPKFRHSPLSITTGILVHMFFIGLPIAVAVRRYWRAISSQAA
jgi:hypothetical protein